MNARDEKGLTILMLAEEESDTKSAKLLIDKGADVNVEDNDGLTALSHTWLVGSDEVQKILIANGAK